MKYIGTPRCGKISALLPAGHDDHGHALVLPHERKEEIQSAGYGRYESHGRRSKPLTGKGLIRLAKETGRDFVLPYFPLCPEHNST